MTDMGTITFYNKGLDRCNEKIGDGVTDTGAFTDAHGGGHA